MITIDAVKGVLSVDLTDEELATRKANWKGPKETIYASGALWKYAQLVGGARLGAVGKWAGGRTGGRAAAAVTSDGNGGGGGGLVRPVDLDQMGGGEARTEEGIHSDKDEEAFDGLGMQERFDLESLVPAFLPYKLRSKLACCGHG